MWWKQFLQNTTRNRIILCKWKYYLPPKIPLLVGGAFSKHGNQLHAPWLQCILPMTSFHGSSPHLYEHISGRATEDSMGSFVFFLSNQQRTSDLQSTTKCMWAPQKLNTIKYYTLVILCNLVFHKLIEFENFISFTWVGDIKHFSVCLEILFRYFQVFQKYMSTCLHMFLKFIIKRIPVFYHDWTGHVVIFTIVLCQLLKQQ